MTLYSYVLSNIYSLSPLFITLILSLVSLLPIMPSGTEEIAPLLGVISLSFWVVNRPDIMGWLSVIIIGIFNDVLYGSLLGIACLSAIIVRLILTKILYKIDLTNIYHTLFYVGLSLIIWLFINILAKHIIYFNFYDYYAVIFQFLVSLVISPIIIFIQLLVLKKMSI